MLVEPGDDRIEDPLIPADEIHLVDRQHRVANAEQAGDKGVAACLCQDSLPCIDQNDRKIGRRRAGRHVAGKKFVPPGVCNDEAASGCREVAVGGIDGDALFAFRPESVHEKRRIDVLAADSPDPAQGGNIVEEALGVAEQAPGERRLAVVDTAADQKAQQIHGFLDGRHQKQPSRFFLSIAPARPRSISMPPRSTTGRSAAR